MKIKKITAVLLSAALLCTIFTSCSSKDAEGITAVSTTVTEVADADDEIKVASDDEEITTIELTDSDENILTVIPVFHSDGVTVIAGYIESAKDKNGNALTQDEYPYIKSVIAVELVTSDDETSYKIKYSSDGEFITMTALSDENGYIIAIQDAIDIDSDKDTEEYFYVVTKLDSNCNLFIKLDKDENGNLINVTVETSSDKKTVTVTDSTGKKIVATNSTQAKNLSEVAKAAKEEKENEQSTTKESATKNSTENKSESTTAATTTTDSAADYISIVLKDNGKVSCNADNVTINEASAVNGGTEVVVNGAGEFSKYYVTSETSTFSGQIEFRFSIGEEVTVKFYNVHISTSKKTAVKFTNVDTEVEKETDSEETGTGNDIGSSAETFAPEVELSFTGENSFKATGSGKNGTIYSECKLGIKGHGSADIDGGPNLSGICSTESVTIKNATLNITSEAKQGISCDKKVTVNTGAAINIDSLGDGIHCNKFVFNGSKDGEIDSTIEIRSLNSVNCSDGIDADEELTINGGTLHIVALTQDKYALKCRKVIKGKASGVFTINGGTVTSAGYQNTTLQSGGQKAVLITTSTASKASVFTVGNVKSESCYSFICSPVSVNRVTSSNGETKDITWSANAGSAAF